MKTLLFALSLSAVSLAAHAAAVEVSVLPAAPLIEQGKTNQLVNFDFLLRNTTRETLDIRELEVSVVAGDGTLITQRRLGANGMSVLTIPNRVLPPEGKLVVFNPLFAFEPELDLANLRFDFTFDSGEEESKYRASITVHPKPYRGRNDFLVPVRGRVLVHDGHDFYSHHRRLDVTGDMTTAFGIDTNMTRYAYDFVVVDREGKLYRGDGTKNEDWYGFGAPIYAPASGTVVEAANDADDNTKTQPYKPDMAKVMKNLHVLFGNYVVIDHHNGEFSMLAHMKKGSVRVKAGDDVKQGAQLGEMGFSGDAFLVHLHYQVQSDAKFGEGLPSYFVNFRRLAGAKWIDVKRGQIDSGDVIEANVRAQ